MLPRPLHLALLGALLLSAAPAASAYRVITRDGRPVDAAAIARLGDGFVLETETGPVALEHGAIDFYATFRENLVDEPGNVLAFRSGGFLRFESLIFDDGRIVIELEQGLVFSIDEALVDFRATVLEGALLELPEGFGGAPGVAKAREPTRPNRAARGGRPAGRDEKPARRRAPTRPKQPSKR